MVVERLFQPDKGSVFVSQASIDSGDTVTVPLKIRVRLPAIENLESFGFMSIYRLRISQPGLNNRIFTVVEAESLA